MRIANRYPRAHFAGELSNLLIARDPNRRSERPWHPEIIELLTKRHSNHVAMINAQYFGGKKRLQIADAMAMDSADTARATAPAEMLFEWAMARLENTSGT